MTANSSTAYPAEYYYPEFIDNRPDDPLKAPPINVPLTSSIDNGIGSTTKIPANVVVTPKKPLNKKQQQQQQTPKTTNLAFDIVTNQGLADTDITQSVKTDPKKNLLRDPAEKNIPRLIVDNSIIQQNVRTPRVPTTNLDNEFSEQALNYNQINNEKTKPHANGYANGDLTNKRKSHDLTKKQTIKYVEDEQPIDDYWKKEVHIDDEGIVTIEPLKYDKNTYEGPFGLTRQGSFIFYIGMGIFTLLAGVFLIMTGVFYSQNYPDSSSKTGVLVGLGVCGLAFYLGLQLILIGLWHQKYRQENPRIIKKKSSRHNDSSAHLKTSMEEDEPYEYPYPEQYDYAAYENYDSYPPPYTSNTTEMLLQQPGAATGAGYYEPVLWPSNVQVETQPDPQFLQPMELSYGARTTGDSPSTAIGFASVSNPFDKNNNNDQTKTEKKSHRHGRHHHKKTVQAEPPKAKFDSIAPASTVIEAPLPVFSKAPETNELLRSIAEAEKNAPPNSTRKNSNRIKPTDDGEDIISLNDHKHHHRGHQSHHRHQRHRHQRHYSSSSCSTCSSRSSRSRDDFYSDAGHGHHHYRHYQHQHSVPIEKVITPRTVRSQTRSPPRGNSRVYRDTGVGAKLHGKIMKDSGVTADLEDVPNVRDNRLEQIPVVRRTIIVEPYPSEPTSQILVKPQSNMTGKIRLGKNQKLNGDNEIIIPASTTFMNKKTKKKKKTNEYNNEDLQLEDVNDDHGNETERSKSRKKNSTRISSKKHVKNAFYD